jgi:hypothetical protein
MGAFRTLEGQTMSGQLVDPLDPLSRAVGLKFDKTIRISAAASLAKQAARAEDKLDDPRAVKALGAMADDENPQLRQIAVYALGFFVGAQAEGILRDRVRSD